MTPTHHRWLLICAHASAVVGTLLLLAAYTSHDRSGLQYIFLSLAAFPAGLALILYVLGAIFASTSVLLVALPVFTLLLAFLPEITGIGLNSEVIDPIGSYSAFALLVAHIVAVILSFRAPRRAAPNVEL